ncbi:unnamed protein product [Camellia sinensis]
MAKSAEEVHPVKSFGWASRDHSGILSPFIFSRRATGAEDVRFKVLYCGICHTDLHRIKNDWGGSNYPLLPGHEVVGVVTEVGSKVQKFKIGDKVGVGCLVGACHSCDHCTNDLENHCPKRCLPTMGPTMMEQPRMEVTLITWSLMSISWSAFLKTYLLMLLLLSFALGSQLIVP